MAQALAAGARRSGRHVVLFGGHLFAGHLHCPARTGIRLEPGGNLGRADDFHHHRNGRGPAGRRADRPGRHAARRRAGDCAPRRRFRRAQPGQRLAGAMVRAVDGAGAGSADHALAAVEHGGLQRVHPGTKLRAVGNAVRHRAGADVAAARGLADRTAGLAASLSVDRPRLGRVRISVGSAVFPRCQGTWQTQRRHAGGFRRSAGSDRSRSPARFADFADWPGKYPAYSDRFGHHRAPGADPDRHRHRSRQRAGHRRHCRDFRDCRQAVHRLAARPLPGQSRALPQLRAGGAGLLSAAQSR